MSCTLLRHNKALTCRPEASWELNNKYSNSIGLTWAWTGGLGSSPGGWGRAAGWSRWPRPFYRTTLASGSLQHVYKQIILVPCLFSDDAVCPGTKITFYYNNISFYFHGLGTFLPANVKMSERNRLHSSSVVLKLQEPGELQYSGKVFFLKIKLNIKHFIELVTPHNDSKLRPIAYLYQFLEKCKFLLKNLSQV